MKKIVITAVLFAIAFSVLADDPFDRVDTNRIFSVVVGSTDIFASNPFAENAEQPPPPQFTAYFEVKDAAIARKLAGFVKQMKKSDDVGVPPVGVLSEQRFLDSASNVVFSTHIVNAHATVIVDSLESFDDAYRKVGHSVPFCRLILDLMKKHCPKIIEEQEKAYRDVNHTLEELLFGKKEQEAQQNN